MCRSRVLLAPELTPGACSLGQPKEQPAVSFRPNLTDSGALAPDARRVSSCQEVTLSRLLNPVLPAKVASLTASPVRNPLSSEPLVVPWLVLRSGSERHGHPAA